MYDFRDVNEVSEVGLPSEALSINGVYIENLVTGYRTLNVSGREALSPEIASYETGVRDGSKVQNKRFPARTITVTYQLIAKSKEAFREAYNELGRVLNVDNATLIFDDEPDKYFIGTPSHIEKVEAGRNAVVGSFEIYCADPFKYSREEYEVEPFSTDLNYFLIDYKGTYKAFPTLEANLVEETEIDDNGSASTLTGYGDCGYFAFFNESKKIVQLGDPEEVDGTGYAKSQTLLNQKFEKSTHWNTTAKNLWTMNSGSLLPTTVSQVGSLAMEKIGNTASYYLTPSSYGSASGKYHGPSMTRTLPADSSGEKGAKNFTLTYKQRMSIGDLNGDTKQLGAFQVQLTTSDGKNVAGIRIYKNTAGKLGKFKLYVNGIEMYTDSIDLSYLNKHFGSSVNSVRTSKIVKSGKKITFTVGRVVRSFTSTEIENLAVSKVTFSFEQYGTNTPLECNGLFWVKFIKDKCGTWKDIPNKFSANDTVIADCKDGKIYLNGVETPALGALGNEWEDFYFTNGLNQIGFAYSDWTTKKPNFKIRYREVFL